LQGCISRANAHPAPLSCGTRVAKVMPRGEWHGTCILGMRIVINLSLASSMPRKNFVIIPCNNARCPSAVDCVKGKNLSYPLTPRRVFGRMDLHWMREGQQTGGKGHAIYLICSTGKRSGNIFHFENMPPWGLVLPVGTRLFLVPTSGNGKEKGNNKILGGKGNGTGQAKQGTME